MVILMSDIRYVLPQRFSAEEVERMLARTWICPFCRAQSTAARNELDTGWVETPLRQTSPKWICLGCCIDIYATCLSRDFNEHPYREIVGQVAAQESLEVTEARRICLDHQLRILEERSPSSEHGRYTEVYHQIHDLLADLT